MPECPRKVLSPPRGGLRRALRAWALAELAAYFVLAIVSTWPLARCGASSLPLGMESAATVPLLNAWTICWNANRAAHRYCGYWDAPIFAGTAGTFAFSEPMPTTVVVAPLIWFGGHRVLAYNGFLLAALTLNGWTAFRLLRCLRLRWLVCALGGGLVEMLPLVHSELGVLQMVPLCGILWTLQALVLFGRRPGWRRSMLLAVAFAVTYLNCTYYGLFLSLVLLPSGLWLVGRPLRQARTWGLLLGGVGAALLLIAPVVAAQLRVIRAHDLRRAPNWIARLSADVRDYAVTPWPQPLEPDFLIPLRHQRYFRLGPGWLKLGLAVLGLAAGCCWRRYRPWTAFCLAMLVAAFLLSLGPRLSWWGWSPYVLLIDWYPGMAQARNVYRFAVFVQLAVVFFAALGLQAVLTRFRSPNVAGEADPGKHRSRNKWRKLPACGATIHRKLEACATGKSDNYFSNGAYPKRTRVGRDGFRYFLSLARLLTVPRAILKLPAACSSRERSSPFRGAATIGLGLLAMTEVFPAAQALFPVPPVTAEIPWIDWLKSQTPDDSVIACVPFPTGTRVEDYEETALWMYWGTYHQRRLVNGYSGFFPPSFLDTKAVMRSFPDDASAQRLQELGVACCVLRRDALPGDAAMEKWFELLFSDDTAQVDIYRTRQIRQNQAP